MASSERGTSARAVSEEMKAADVFIFTDGGLDESTVVCSVDPSSGSPVFTDGPFVETKEQPRRLRGRRCARRCRGAVLGRPDRGRGRLAAGGAASRIPCGSRPTRSPGPCLDWDVLVPMAWRLVAVRVADLTAVVVACNME